MGDVTVPRGATNRLGRVDGDLELQGGSRVEPEGSSPIEIAGEVRCRGDAEFRGSLTCAEFSADEGKVLIQGDLKVLGNIDVKHCEFRVDGNLEARSVDVERKLSVGKDAKADEFDIGGLLEIEGQITARSVDVGGLFRVGGSATVEDIDVGGSVDVQGPIKTSKLDVGGKANVAGGEISDLVDVGGSFVSSKPLKFRRIDVGGSVTLAEGGEGNCRCGRTLRE